MVCPIGEITPIPAREHDQEGLVSPDVVNGKSILRKKPKRREEDSK